MKNKVINFIKVLIFFILSSSCCDNCFIFANDKYAIESVDTFVVVTDFPEEKFDGKLFGECEKRQDDCICTCNKFVEYIPILYNDCSDDNRLIVIFNLSIDAIVDDTILIRKIEIDEIRDFNHKIVKREKCEESFLGQLYKKTYLYKCKCKYKLKQVKLTCMVRPVN